MPGSLLHQGATVMCSHGGQATPATPFPRVKVAGQAVVTQSSPYTIAGCGFAPPNGNGPCATASFVSAATRILAGGAPVLLQDSVSVCVPTGTPTTVTVVQTRVTGS
jgi:hypothetical protein